MIFCDMTIVHSDTISITTKGFCYTIDIIEKVADFAEASKVVNGTLMSSARGLPELLQL